MLSQMCSVEILIDTRYLRRNEDVINVMAETLSMSARAPPRMLANLTVAPVEFPDVSRDLVARGKGSTHDDGTGGGVGIDTEVLALTIDVEVSELKEQMLVLRNANLTQHEREGTIAAQQSPQLRKDTYGFLSTMEILETEIVLLEDAVDRNTGVGMVKDTTFADYSSMLSKVCTQYFCTVTSSLISPPTCCCVYKLVSPRVSTTLTPPKKKNTPLMAYTWRRPCNVL